MTKNERKNENKNEVFQPRLCSGILSISCSLNYEVNSSIYHEVDPPIHHRANPRIRESANKPTRPNDPSFNLSATCLGPRHKTFAMCMALGKRMKVVEQFISCIMQAQSITYPS
jgi:hypothetical protein